MGKSTISMAIFNSYFDITRGYISPIIADSWMLLPFVNTIPQVLVLSHHVSGLELGHVLMYRFPCSSRHHTLLKSTWSMWNH